MHLDGSSELGDDFTETIHALKKILSKLQTKRLFTFGISAGGFGAMRYGLHLNAEAVLCFSPPVFVFHPEEVRAKAFLKRLSGKFKQHEVDIRKDFAQFQNSDMQTFVYYGEANSADRIQAELLTSIKNVELRALKNYEHHASIHKVMTEYGLLQTLKKHWTL